MKSREPLLRAKRFQIDDARRRLAQIDAMIAEFERMAQDLNRDIQAEEQRSGMSDPKHFAYPPLAAAARTRRENLLRSAAELKVQREEASGALADAEADLALAQTAGELERVGKAESGSARRAHWRSQDIARA